MKNKNGFTLIELLAVIVILGILLSLSTVAVNKIKTNQDSENRKNIISSILTGAKAYVAEHPNIITKGSVKVDDIINSNFVSFDTTKYSDLKGTNVNVSIEKCENNNNKLKYSITDNGTKYNDCGCEEQPTSNNQTTSNNKTSAYICTE